MPMSTAQRNEMLAALDDNFSPLDLSGFPSYDQPAPEAHDDRFSRDWRDTPLNTSARALRSFVSDPDVDALDRVGQETGHPGFRAEVRDRRGETIAEAFKRANPAYVTTPENYTTIVETLAWNALSTADQEGDVDEVVARLIERGFWTVPNLTACYRALTAEGLLTVAAGSTRALSSAERLKVSRMAQAGNIDAAIEEYLKRSLDEDELDEGVAYDPAYRDACDTAVQAVFEDTQLDYTPTAERRAYLARYAAGRPLTLALLQQAWRACQANEQKRERGELLSPLQRPQASEPPANLDTLSDEAVDSLYHSSLRAYADQYRRPQRVST
jgi:hypothetical protein